MPTTTSPSDDHDAESRLSLIEKLFLAIEAEVTRQGKALAEIHPALRTEFIAFLAGRASQLAADNRAALKSDTDAQATAIRLELHTFAEEKMAQLWAREQGAIEQIKASLHTFARELIGEKVTELAAQTGSQLSAFDARLKQFAAPLQSTPGDPAAPLTPTTTDFVSNWAGQWTPTLVLRRNHFVSFRGSVYLVLRDARNIVPTKQSQKGPNAAYALFTPSGAPGPKGVDGLSVASLVTFPAAANSAGVAGTFAYSAGFMAACVVTNTWVFWPVSSDYPL